MRHSFIWAGVLVAAAWWSACTTTRVVEDDDDGGSCQPGTQVACQCGLNSNGMKSCLGDGSGYGACECEGTTVSVGGNGGFGGNGVTTTTSVGGNGGFGGNPNCASCSEYLLDSTGTVTIDQVCGYDFQTDTCNPGSSCALVEAVGICTCGTDINGTGAMCFTECMLSCTSTGMDQSNCQDCVLNNCAGPANNCLADPGTP